MDGWMDGWMEGLGVWIFEEQDEEWRQGGEVREGYRRRIGAG